MGKLLTVLSLALALGLPAGAAPLIPGDYRGWEKTTKALLNYPIPGHLDHYRIPYINRIGMDVKVETKAGRVTYAYPKGTIIVKEAYRSLAAPKPGEEPVLVYAMIKDPENPNARGGWVWVLKDTTTGKESVDQSPLCLGCHSAANDTFPYGDKNLNADFRDYVFFPYRK
jgi:hypothetical protein